MNLDALRNFVAIAEAGSIREAADHLHIAQSALSRQIQSLETALGAVLLVRLPRGIEPTGAGQVLLRHARAVLDQIAHASDEIAAMEGLRSGTIRIAAIEPVAEQLLPGAIARFRQSHPGMSFDVRVGNTPQVMSLVRENVAELGITFNAPPDRETVLRGSAPQPLVAVMHAGHAFGKRSALSLGEIVGAPLILPPAGSPTRLLIEEAARRIGRPVRQVVLESDSVALRLALAQQTDAIAILAHLSSNEASDRRRLAAVPIEDPILSAGRLDLIAGAHRQLSSAILEFERIFRSVLKQSSAIGKGLGAD